MINAIMKGAGRSKIAKVMGEYKSGALKSGSGSMVRNRKQAVAIALNGARQAGASIPTANDRVIRMHERLQGTKI